MAQEQRVATNQLPEIVYLICWDDEFELPVYVADDIKEIMEFFKVNIGTAYELINGQTRFGLKIEVVRLEQNDTE